MSAELDLRRLASEIKGAQDNAHQIEPFTARFPGFDLAAGYEVAHHVHSDRLSEGANAIGRKIGFTNPQMWAKYGVREPVWAYVYDTTVVQLEDKQATCRLTGFTEPKIEPEIVFGFRAAPPDKAGPLDVLNSIEWVAHGFEIVQSHFPGWKFQAADTVADWALHGALLIGPRQPLPRLGDDVVAALESFTLTLSCDGRPVANGRGADVLGSPLAAIVHLLSTLDSQPNDVPLQAGEIVTTGTVTTACSVRTGENWRSELQGIALPGLTVDFAS